jgi:diadenosine tetraphosphatase ApaH/serine/threonine PP2A family protein phosphatase
VLYVHGSPRNHLNEYVFPEDIENERKMTRLGEMFGRVCFNGHTHIPGIFIERSLGKWEFIGPEECETGFPIDGHRLICNVGSVGQPRDGDWRACYVLFDGSRIWFRRVAYDVETTIRKIYAVPELENFLGDRLRDGR